MSLSTAAQVKTPRSESFFTVRQAVQPDKPGGVSLCQTEQPDLHLEPQCQDQRDS